MHSGVMRALVVAVAVVVMFGSSLVVADIAFADQQRCQTDPVAGIVRCWLVHDSPSRHGGGGGDSGGGCRSDVKTVPCYIRGEGAWDAQHSCYSMPMNPQPPFGNPLWQGHSTGTVYRCIGGQGAGFFWSQAAPLGPPPAAVLAQRAETMIQLPTWTTGSNGGPSHTTYVGIPTWLWIAGIWRVQTSPPAAVAGESVTATATPMTVVWTMGDGSSSTCDGPGAPFSSADPNHPPCGYTYRVDSLDQPQTGPSMNDRYFIVRGTVTWQITWQCTGNCDETSGRLPALTRTTTPLPLRVFQVETVTTGGH